MGKRKSMSKGHTPSALQELQTTFHEHSTRISIKRSPKASLKSSFQRTARMLHGNKKERPGATGDDRFAFTPTSKKGESLAFRKRAKATTATRMATSIRTAPRREREIQRPEMQRRPKRRQFRICRTQTSQSHDSLAFYQPRRPKATKVSEIPTSKSNNSCDVDYARARFPTSRAANPLSLENAGLHTRVQRLCILRAHLAGVSWADRGRFAGLTLI